ncbi:hypothetical protein HYC85_032182 [Camellia sinensis]|uniref:Alpha-ketoglutarate-dependent dioxygenase AlkB-like domain-containing protein n=1 Tax=Camellia sinensis TaxID=4442 RepID=A0A7J7FSR0_CAMSI|nr:hypothetical protein HYC85_032182 [Camellia sinensis]
MRAAYKEVVRSREERIAMVGGGGCDGRTNSCLDRGMERGENLSNFVVGSVPTVFYIPDFITDSEQDQLLNKIYQAPVSKWKSLKNRKLQNWGGVVHEKGLLAQDLPPWLKRVTERIFEESCLFPSAINHVLINEYLPNQGIMAHQDGPAYFPVVAILSLGSPVVMDFTPHSTLQLCTNTLTNNVDDKLSDGAFDGETEKWSDDHLPFSVLLMPRSLLIFKDKAYSDYLHGIKDSEVQQYDKAVNVDEILKYNGVNQALSEPDKAFELNRIGDVNTLHRLKTRVSLTCRVVSRVHKNLFKF